MNAANIQTQANVRRNGLIAKIHVAKNQLAIPDDNYRLLLEANTGKSSCSDMNIHELETIMDVFKKLGFSGKPRPKRSGSKPMANTDHAKKIRALWLMLYHLGEISDSSEEALAAFCERTTGLANLQWLTSDHADKLIKALRGWLKRVGYYFPDAVDYRYFGNDGLAENISLINRQADILLIGDIYKWLAENGFGKVAALQYMERDDLLQVIELLGKKVRAKKAQ